MKHPPATRSTSTHILSLSLVAAILGLGMCTAALAQTPVTANRSGDFSNRPVRVLTAQRTGDVTGTVAQQEVLANWDGTAENGYTLVTDPGGAVHFVQEFFFSEDGTVDTLTSCFFFDQPAFDFTFEVLVLASNNGAPGAFLADEQFFLAGTTSGDTCIESTLSMPITAAAAFFGVRFPETPGVFLGIDENGPRTSPSFTRAADSEPWTEIREFVEFTNYRNLAVELLFTADEEPPPVDTCPAVACVEDDETLCLLGDRFKVTAGFRNIFDESGPAKAGPEITPDTGFFHFPNDPTNVEVTVKAIDACNTGFQSYWFFAAGMTDQEFTLRVCDTVSGIEKTYFDPLGERFVTITDTSAFFTCP